MNILYLIFVAVAAAFIIRMVIRARPGIALAIAQAAVKSGTAVLVDIREPAEWPGGVAKSAALLPLSDLRGSRKQWGSFLTKHAGKKFLLYCQSGTRSDMAAAQLCKEGLDAVNARSCVTGTAPVGPSALPRLSADCPPPRPDFFSTPNPPHENQCWQH